MLGLTLGCNVITCAAAGEQAARSSDLPSPLAGEEVRSFAEQDVQASNIFEECRVAIQQERQALKDSREYFLATLTAHTTMVNRPIMRNDLGVRDFLGGIGVNEIQPVLANYREVSRCSATPPPNNYRDQIPSPARSAAVAVLIEGSADRQLEDAEVQLYQRYDGSPPRRARRGWSPLRTGIAEFQNPDKYPDLRAGGWVEQDPIPYQGGVLHFVALLRHEEQVGAYRQLGLDPGVRLAMRQEIPPPLGGEAS